jgi:hypothetical protein
VPSQGCFGCPESLAFWLLAAWFFRLLSGFLIAWLACLLAMHLPAALDREGVKFATTATLLAKRAARNLRGRLPLESDVPDGLAALI